jgi:hypothetical protein
MDKQQTKKLATELLSHLPEFSYVTEARALCLTPVGNLFRGVIFESSGFSKEVFYPNAFVQPLYVSSEHWVLTVGVRLHGDWHYIAGQEPVIAKSLFEEMTRQKGFRLLEDLSSPKKLATTLHKYYSNLEVPHLKQTVAYSCAVCGDFSRALRELDTCISTLRKMQVNDPGIMWHQVLLDEVAQFRGLVAADPEAAQSKLQEWTEQTRTALHLPL